MSLRSVVSALLLVGLMLGNLMLAAPDAHAGSYSAPVYSGGQYYMYYGPPGPYPYIPLGDLNHPAGTTTGDSDAQTSSYGTLTATFTWSTANSATDPAPPVIIEQDSAAHWTAYSTSQPTASCADGLGDPEVDSGSSGFYSANSRGTHYTVVQPDASGTVMVTLVGAQAQMDYTSGGGVDNGSLGVQWTVSAYPITISLGGTTKDSSGNDNILVGQNCTPTLTVYPKSREPTW